MWWAQLTCRSVHGRPGGSSAHRLHASACAAFSGLCLAAADTHLLHCVHSEVSYLPANRQLLVSACSCVGTVQKASPTGRLAGFQQANTCRVAISLLYAVRCRMRHPEGNMQLLQQAQMHFKVPPAQAGLAGTDQTRCVVIPQACDGLAAQEEQQQPTAGMSLVLVPRLQPATAVQPSGNSWCSQF